jgi:DNA-directed RNA polymerase subunit RPC12/RpoP
MRRIMWRCLKCKSEVEEKHAFCWHCGAKRVPPAEQKTTQPAAVPGFASFEQLAPEPASHGFVFRRSPMIRIVWVGIVVVIFVISKILASHFFGAYGLYIFAVVAVVGLIVVLWRFFRRDTSEGVGIDLH